VSKVLNIDKSRLYVQYCRSERKKTGKQVVRKYESNRPHGRPKSRR